MRQPIRLLLALVLLVPLLVPPPAGAEAGFSVGVQVDVRQLDTGFEATIRLSPSIPECGQPDVTPPCWRDLRWGLGPANADSPRHAAQDRGDTRGQDSDRCRTDVSPLPDVCTRYFDYADMARYSMNADEWTYYDRIRGSASMLVNPTLDNDDEYDVDGDVVDVSTGPAPRTDVDFTIEATGNPGEYRFTSTSTHSLGWGLEHTWNLGDGTHVEDVTSITHTYSEDRPYEVYLFVIDDRGITFDDVLKEVNGEESPLGASISFPGRDRAEVALDEELEVTVILSLDDAAPGPLSGIRPTTSDHAEAAPLLRHPEDAFEVVGGDPVPEAGWTLAPGESVNVSVVLQPLQPGTVTFRTDLVGVGAAGGQVEGMPAERTIKVLGDGLGVEVVADPSNVKLNGDTDGDGTFTEEDNQITVEVTISNGFEQPLTDLAFLEPADEPLKWTTLLPEQPEVGLRHLAGSDVPTDIPDLPAGEQVTLTYTLEAFDTAIAELEALVSGSLAGQTEIGRGTDEVRVISDLLVEARFDVEDRPYTSGAPVRVFGSLTNVTQQLDDEGNVVEEGVPIGVVVVPLVEGNGGGGHPFPDGFAGRTPLGPRGFVIEPGDTIDVQAIVGTTEQERRSDVTITYGVEVWAHETDEDGQRIFTPGAPTQVEIVEEDGWSATHDVRLRFNKPVADVLRACEGLTLLDYAGCGLIIGIKNLARSLYDLAVFGVVEAVPGSWRAWGHAANLNNLAWRAVLGSDTAKQQLYAILEEDLRSLVEAGAVGADVLAQIPALSNAAIDEAIRVTTEGDLESAAQYTGQAIGENVDALAGPVLKTADAIIKARALKTIMEGATRTDGFVINLLEVAEQNRRFDLLEAVAEARAGGRIQDLPTSGLLRSGDDVTNLPHVWRDAYGAGEDDIRYLRQIAEANGVNIAFRSRHPRSLELLTTGRGWPKPQSTKLKTVSQLDIDYLGYRPDTLATIELVEPPVDWRLRGADLDRALDAEMANIANRHPELNSNEDLFAQVRERLKLRTEEFESGVQDFIGFAEDGVELDFNYGFNNAPNNTFAPGRGTLDPELPGRGNARVGLVEGPDTSRRYFTLEMAGPDGTDFRPLTGDIDFVAILTPDGKLPSLDVRKRVYAQLQRLLSMQHGESFSITLDRIRERFLLPHVEGVDGAEALMVAGADGRLRAGYFQDNRSITRSTPNSHLSNSAGDTDYLLIGGAPAEAISAATPGNVSIPTLAERLGGRYTPHAVAAPGKLNLLVERLEEQALRGSYVRDEDGELVRADRAGGLEQYLPHPGDEGSTTSFAQGSPDPAVQALESFGVPGQAPQTGALGGAWVPVSVEDALAAGDPDVLELAPMTVLNQSGQPGDPRVAVATPEDLFMDTDTPWFDHSDTVVVDPGGPNEERVQIVRGDPGQLVLASPLRHQHPAGTSVVLVERGDGVVRLSGLSRFDTAAAISSASFEPGVEVAYVATGLNFPDALAAGPMAGGDDAPILLTGEELPAATERELERLRPGRVVVLGGEAVVPAGVVQALRSLRLGPVTRIAGTNRFETAAAIAEAAFDPGVEIAYVATGGAFPDALAAGPPAGAAGGPVLLVGDTLPEPTAAALTRLQPARIVVIGGPNAVPEAIVDELAAFTSGTVDRLSGVSRIDTAAAVVADAYDGPVDVVSIATGDNFPDALAGVPPAVATGGPLLLVGDDVADSVADQLRRLSPDRIVVLGGEAAIDEEVVAALRTLLG